MSDPFLFVPFPIESLDRDLSVSFLPTRYLQIQRTLEDSQSELEKQANQARLEIVAYNRAPGQ